MNFSRVAVAAFLPFILGLILFSALSFYVVEPGFTAIHLRLGSLQKQVSEPGYYLKIPLIDKVVLFDTRIQKADIETSAMSKDLQTVSIGMVINYRLENALKIYQEIGIKFEEIIINPFAQESVKAIVAQFTAENLIQQRHEAKEKVIAELRRRLAANNIFLIDFNFTHLDFSSEFMKAVEEKQIAEQSAKRAHNLTEKVKEEALQTRERAQAEAYALKIKREALTDELIRLQQIEAELKAIEKWNGVLPSVTGANIPFLNTLNLDKKSYK